MFTPTKISWKIFLVASSTLLASFACGGEPAAEVTTETDEQSLSTQDAFGTVDILANTFVEGAPSAQSTGLELRIGPNGSFAANEKLAVDFFLRDVMKEPLNDVASPFWFEVWRQESPTQWKRLARKIRYSNEPLRLRTEHSFVLGDREIGDLDLYWEEASVEAAPAERRDELVGLTAGGALPESSQLAGYLSFPEGTYRVVLRRLDEQDSNNCYGCTLRWHFRSTGIIETPIDE